jgi:hypothetical protein
MRPLTTTPFRLSFCLAAIVATLIASRARADDFQLDREQIRAALHTTAVEEDGFIDRTVGMVEAGKLPRDMFVSCFIYARRKTHRQFQYFKAALTTRAAEIGITL